MGLLLDQYFWAGVVNAVHHADKGFLDDESSAQAVARINCEVFGKLLNDSELERDVSRVWEESIDLRDIEGAYENTSVHALRALFALEIQILEDAGIESRVAREIMSDVASLYANDGKVDRKLSPEKFIENLRVLREVSCEGTEQFTKLESQFIKSPQRRSRWAVTKKTVAGIAVCAANSGSATALAFAFGPWATVPSSVSLISLGKGKRLWLEAWNGEW